MKRSVDRAFTLVEMLIVLVIMGILAAIVVPQFAGASADARYSATIDNLQDFRQAIDRYRNDHYGRFPGVEGANPDSTFAEQMILPTNSDGQRSSNSDQGFGDSKFPFGPYLPNQLPPNPFNGSRRVQTVTTFTASAPGGASSTDPGWIYEITSARIRINYGGAAPNGQNYWTL